MLIHSNLNLKVAHCFDVFYRGLDENIYGNDGQLERIEKHWNWLCDHRELLVIRVTPTITFDVWTCYVNLDYEAKYIWNMIDEELEILAESIELMDVLDGMEHDE